MTSQNGWRRVAGALAGSAIAGSAHRGRRHADGIGRTGDDRPRTPRLRRAEMTGDQALAIIAERIRHRFGRRPALQPRSTRCWCCAMPGFKPSNANKDAIVAALDKRPNQAPLIDALQETIAYQRQNPGAGGSTAGSNRAASTASPSAGRPIAVRPGRRHPRRPGRLTRRGRARRKAAAASSSARRTAAPLLLIGDDELLYNPRLRRAYRIEDGIPVLLVDEAVDVTDAVPSIEAAAGPREVGNRRRPDLLIPSGVRP